MQFFPPVPARQLQGYRALIPSPASHFTLTGRVQRIQMASIPGAPATTYPVTMVSPAFIV
ncbi:hypothetical protein KCP77_21115 [Salmonella enterica subsp. enterica]|nr:hypothetical protein KCP77_21115 [Salmonella enterica subsp. enterica]